MAWQEANRPIIKKSDAFVQTSLTLLTDAGTKADVKPVFLQNTVAELSDKDPEARLLEFDSYHEKLIESFSVDLRSQCPRARQVKMNAKHRERFAKVATREAEMMRELNEGERTHPLPLEL
jgi:hypothetical protein